MELTYFITDVFGSEKYSGNQLATFLNAGILSKEQMQKIAFEIGFSETTFITTETSEAESFDVRIFTPFEEVPFAGHPSIGTAFIIQQFIKKDIGGCILLNEKVGQIPLEYKDGIWWMQQQQPTFGKVYDASVVATLLSLGTGDLVPGPPVQQVSTGLPFVIVPVKSLEALKKAKVDKELYDAFFKDEGLGTFFLFTEEAYTPQQQIAARMFANCLGIPEDPATGSANGCLAAYLLEHCVFNTGNINLRVGQGVEMNRPSEIIIQASKKKSSHIKVGGNVILLAEGRWFAD